MINSANIYSVSLLFNIDANVVYAVPRYQREYTWTKTDWERLFDDILENEPGYFLGSIICINSNKDALATSHLEIVDGQQRLTTLSLLLAAVYSSLNARKTELDDENLSELFNLKRKLVLRYGQDQLRVEPQIQGSNLMDYRSVMSEIGIVAHSEVPYYAGNRKIYRAFRYFLDRLRTIGNSPEDRSRDIMEFLTKINQATMVKIEVAGHADAYVLFESLNDRGVPLTPVDLIKNKLLAKLETIEPGKIEHYFTQWNKLLVYLGDDYSIQERFFRQYYNAFKDELNAPFRQPEDKRKDPLGTVATRSNLMQIYERLINKDPYTWFQNTLQAGKTYSALLSGWEDNPDVNLGKSYRSLHYSQGAPSYLLILYLLERRTMLDLGPEHLTDIVCGLVRFFVRRNLTDTPPTRDLTRIFMRIIEMIDGLSGEAVVETILQQLTAVSASDEAFRSKLEGPIYDENLGVARFILCTLAERGMTRENRVDLWQWQNKHYTWTVEHIFPKSEEIPAPWVEMIADGNVQLAREYQQRYVHTLGNLTMSAYNSPLGTKSFAEKRELKDRDGRWIGYRNGLSINETVKAAERWGVTEIEDRTRELVSQSLEVFRLESRMPCF